ncbi:hypothetical protein JX265_014125 [Neoarthrinium moseri]|uniref:Uncharacterized protein n=1 Tax=Neoarthrinium moseri TaxID=1658444 RepID=A0A9P9W788_9PEZI|nr:hypothetical protein JX265_014125 [Neoarthrinium moseri]
MRSPAEVDTEVTDVVETVDEGAVVGSVSPGAFVGLVVSVSAARKLVCGSVMVVAIVSTTVLPPVVRVTTVDVVWVVSDTHPAVPTCSSQWKSRLPRPSEMRM